jgi:hypothetical protein
MARLGEIRILLHQREGLLPSLVEDFAIPQDIGNPKIREARLPCS